MAVWRKLAQDSPLAELIDRLNQWATDTDRLRKALFAARSTSSVSQSLALNNSLQVDSTRVSGLASGSTGSGSTLTAGGTNTNVQFNTSGDLDGDNEFTWKSTAKILGITGQVIITGGLSASGGVTFSTALTGTDGTFVNLTASTLTVTNRATLQSLAVSTLLGVTGAVDFRSTLGVTGLIMGAAGLSVTGGVTCDSLGVANGATFGGTVRLAGGTMFLTSGLGIEPVVNNVCSLGRSIRRFGNIFGATGNFSGNLTVGQSITAVNARLSGTLGVDGGVAQDWVQTAGTSFSLGQPNSGQEWAQLSMIGPILLRKGPDLASGTTLFLQSINGGNYYDVTGGTTIAGISTEVIAGGDAASGSTWPAGTPLVLRLDSNPAFSNSADLAMTSGWTFYGSTGDHLGLVKEAGGSGNAWREAWRNYGTLRSTAINLLSYGIIWTNMPAAETELLGVTTFRWQQDLSGYQYARLSLAMDSDTTLLGATGSILHLQYSTDQSTWSALSLAGGSAPLVRADVIGVTAGPWVSIAPGARADCFLRVMGVSGDGAQDFFPLHLELELK